MPCQYKHGAKTGTRDCAGKEVTTVKGVDTSTEHLCCFHYQFKYGQSSYGTPIVKEA